jgi:hypothetical protein
MDERRAGDRSRSGRETACEYEALADAVGQETPGEKRRGRTEADRPEDDACLAEREVEVRPQVGRE